MIHTISCTSFEDIHTVPTLANASIRILENVAYSPELLQIRDRKMMAERLTADAKILRTQEKQGKPIVALVSGKVSGLALELALSAHYRIALKGSTFGYEAIKSGFMPAYGGVTRLARILGIQAAIAFFTEGKSLNAEAALEKGIIHAIAENQEQALVLAENWINENPSPKQIWDSEGYKIPGGATSSPSIAATLPILPAILKQKTKGIYPAYENILLAALDGGNLEIEAAFRTETRYAAEILAGAVCRNLSGFQEQLRALRAGESRPEDMPVFPVKKIGVLGAGMMGKGIALVAAKAGIEVVLLDVSSEKAEAGKAYSQEYFAQQIAKGKTTEAEAQAILAHIHPSTEIQDLADADLVIEAVFEKRELKAEMTAKVAQIMDETSFFASNTSTLPITGLAEAFPRPERFIGLHFFSPVEKMELVEIILGEETTDETLAYAFDFVLQIGKTPIVVYDSRGFYTSRVFSSFVMEGAALLGEGAHPREIEFLAQQAGMPVGPLALLDEISLQLVLDIRTQTQKDLETEGEEYVEHPGTSVVRKVAISGRTGKARGAGFYEYPPKDSKASKVLWAGLQELFPYQNKISAQDIQDRMIFAQVIESINCRIEGVLSSVIDANVGSVYGWGFAPQTGGTIQFVHSYGIENFAKRAAELAAAYGERFVLAEDFRDWV